MYNYHEVVEIATVCCCWKGYLGLYLYRSIIVKANWVRSASYQQIFTSNIGAIISSGISYLTKRTPCHRNWTHAYLYSYFQYGISSYLVQCNRGVLGMSNSKATSTLVASWKMSLLTQWSKLLTYILPNSQEVE
ncbi:hypothetical protein DL89DRAFT_82184 [Linderina pennispora]|uniref:Uncharacterized protein n=1 Tax=Linderina pennispora TaxID=61395 RepID=A0A1Y1WGT1_9FUNG|nr:uncharacterized protein DL89DRAFT_82184 [Linderina pennispora]ORX72733.1 hypothetical protein DL89DRAFT_82184 [Linderina pennispora]